MTDGPRFTPDVPPGWAAEQPPPYTGTSGPWAAPGGPSADGRGGSGGPHPTPAGGAYGPGPGHGSPSHGPHGHPAAPYPPPQAPRPGIIPLRPLGVGDILDGTIRLIRSNPKATLGVSAVLAAIAMIPSTLADLVVFSRLEEMLSRSEVADSTTLFVGLDAELLGTVLSTVMSLLVTTIITGVLTHVLGRAVFGGRITLGEAWRLAGPRIWALLGLALLQILILLLPALVAVSVLVMAVLAGMAGTADALGSVLLLLALLVLGYIPYVLFIQTRLSLASPAIVLERLNVPEAMRRSWRLVRGDSWRVLGITLLASLLAFVMNAIVSFPVALVAWVIARFADGTGLMVVEALLLSAGGVLGAMITYPFQAGVAGLLYVDRRMRAEAFDIVLRSAAAQHQALGWVHAGVDELWRPSQAAWSGEPHGAGPGTGPYANLGGLPYYGPGEPQR